MYTGAINAVFFKIKIQESQYVPALVKSGLYKFWLKFGHLCNSLYTVSCIRNSDILLFIKIKCLWKILVLLERQENVSLRSKD